MCRYTSDAECSQRKTNEGGENEYMLHDASLTRTCERTD
jgi:hypothetical protein